MAKSNAILCRLCYLVTPKPELFAALHFDPKSGHASCQPTAVITPQLDYEENFEGWKQAWKSKAKHDFIIGFVNLWSNEFQAFTGRLGDVGNPEYFDSWWTITELDIIEIDPAWRAS